MAALFVFSIFCLYRRHGLCVGSGTAWKGQKYVKKRQSFVIKGQIFGAFQVFAHQLDYGCYVSPSVPTAISATASVSGLAATGPIEKRKLARSPVLWTVSQSFS